MHSLQTTIFGDIYAEIGEGRTIDLDKFEFSVAKVLKQENR